MNHFFSSICCALLFISTSAFATTWSESQSFLVRYNFNKVAFGKPVSEVYVHSGILRTPSHCMGEGPSYWEKTTHIRMVKINGHFFAKARFKAYTGECQATINGPVVQYWVYFTDGTHMITDTVAIPTTMQRAQSDTEYQSLQNRQLEIFNTVEDAGSTYGNACSYGYAS